MEMKEALNKIEELGWDVNKEDENLYRLSIYSPEGQDFSINVEVGRNVDEFIDNIYESYENYDPSYEASLWIGEDGHGKNGAPYELEDLLEDMKWCEQAIYDLWMGLDNHQIEGKEINDEEKLKELSKEQLIELVIHYKQLYNDLNSYLEDKYDDYC